MNQDALTPGQDGHGPTLPTGTETTSHDASTLIQGDAPADSIDYKEKFSNSSREAQRLHQEVENLRTQIEASRAAEQARETQRALEMMQAQQHTPAPAPTSSGWTAEDDAALERARENYETSEVNRLERKRYDSLQTQLTQQVNAIQNSQREAEWKREQHKRLTALQKEPEFQDPTAQNEIRAEIMRLAQISPAYQQDPLAAAEAALDKYRAKQVAGLRTVEEQATASAYVPTGVYNPPQALAPGDAPTKFDSGRHLSPTELESVRDPSALKVLRVNGPDAAKAKIWNALPESERKRRLAGGDPSHWTVLRGQGGSRRQHSF